MLFDGSEVRIVKNCDRGLENAARGRIFKSEVFSAGRKLDVGQMSPKRRGMKGTVRLQLLDSLISTQPT